MGPQRRNLLARVAIVGLTLAAWEPTIVSAQVAIHGGLRLAALAAMGSKTDGEPAENVFLPAERIVLQRLGRARELLGQARYGEAVRYLGAILDGPEDYFFQPDKKLPIHHSLKAEAQRLIGQMPRRGRELYELQYGAEARRMLAEAVSAGDAARLAEVSRRFFHTQAGYEATLLLGLDHLDHGHPLAGALTLRRLREAGAQPDQFEPTLSLVTATCWLQAGVPEKARLALSALKERRGSRAVGIAGTQVPVFGKDSEAVRWLSELITPQRPAIPSVGHAKHAAPNGRADADRWVMFRGNPSRNASTAGGTPLLNIRWRIPATDDPLVEDILRRDQQIYLESGVPILPGLHPLVVDDVVLMRSARNLLAADFVTGKRLWKVPVDEPLERATTRTITDQFGRQTSPLVTGLSYRTWDDATYGTMSSDGQLVFTIEDLGMSIRSPSRRRVPVGASPRTAARRPYNRLAAHDIRTEGKLKWHLGGPADQYALRQAGAFFLGPPLPLLGQLYVLAEIKEEIRLMALDARTGDLLWSQQLAVVEQNIAMDPLRRVAGASPSYCDGILVCPTSAGAVVAVDLATRSLLWGYRYGRPETRQHYSGFAFGAGPYLVSPPAQRWADGTAAVVQGRVVVSPVDSDSLYCLNLINGTLLWKYRRNDDLYVACICEDRVVLVGRREIRALSLSETVEGTETVETIERTGNSVKVSQSEAHVRTPKPAWGGRTVPLPEGSMPSGRGFLAGNQYFVPLTSAAVVAIDLVAGEVAHVSKSRKADVPGNLVCYKGKIISQGFDGLESFYQLEAARREIDRRLAAQPDDPVALSLRGEILLHEEKQSEAVACFRRAYALDAAPRTRSLLRDALLDGLQSQFAAHRDRTEEIEQLLDSPAQRATYLRLMATGLQDAGEWRAALDHYLKLIDLDQDHRGLEPVTPSLSVRRDRWIQARLAELRREAKDGSPAIDRAIEARQQAALEAAGLPSLRRFLDYFGTHPTAGKIRHELFRRLKDSDQLLEAEMVLWHQQQSSDPAVAGPAVAALAELLRQSEHYQDAAVCYRRLGEEFGQVVCRDGKSGQELLDALPGDGSLRQVLRRDTTWPMGEVEVKTATPKRTRTSLYGRYALPYRGDPGVFFAEKTIRFDQSRRSILGYDARGHELWKAPLVSASSPRPNLPFDPGLTHGRVRGHLLLLSMSYKIAAIDTLGSSDAGGPRLLWSHNLTSPGFDAASLRRFPFQVRNVAWGWPGVHLTGYRNRMGALGPVTSRQVCFQQHRDLVAADPLSGDILWVRHNIAPQSVLFGDDELLFAIAPDQEEALVFRALDGKLLGKRKVPRTKHTDILPEGAELPTFASFDQSCIATLGRQILIWRPEGSQRVLELFDPWQQHPVWPPRTFAAEAKACLVGQEALGVFERNGHFVLLSLSDGRTIVDTKLEPEKDLSEIFVFRLGNQFMLVTNCQHHRQAGNRPMTQQIPGALFKPICRGRAYSFDLEGNALWPEPPQIEDQHLLLNQPGRLPVLAFACQIYDRKQRGAARQRVSVLCLDKRTGRQLCRSEFPGTTTSFELRGDPEKDTVTLRLNQRSVTLTFTDKPIPPPSEEKDATNDKLPKSARALWKALETAIAGTTGKSTTPADKKEETRGTERPEF